MKDIALFLTIIIPVMMSLELEPDQLLFSVNKHFYVRLPLLFSF